LILPLLDAMDIKGDEFLRAPQCSITYSGLGNATCLPSIKIGI